jgi:hypothetical protein
MKIKKNAFLPVCNSNRGGYIMFSLVIFGVLIMCIAMSAMLSMKHTLHSAKIIRTSDNSLNIAEAGKEHFLSLLRRDSVGLKPNYDSVYLNGVPFDVGSYTVRCLTNAAIDTLIVRSTGTVNGQSTTVETVFRRSGLTSYPIKALVMSRRFNTLSGNISIDGREWDTLGTAAVGNGVPGIFTCDSIVLAGSAAVGGPSLDSAPPSPKGARAGSVLNWGDSTTFPRLPETILGVDSGALDTFKTPPPWSPPWNFTCNGIVYWDTVPPNCNQLTLSGRGIFICHNAKYTTVLKNVHGSFKGIIIADRIDKINSGMDFLGAIFTLSRDSISNIYGNGNPTLRYSSQIVNTELKKLLQVKIDLVSWKEF